MAILNMGVSRKQSTSNFPKNEHFLPPDLHTYVFISGGKKCSFSGKFDMLCFLETPVLRFALLPYYQRFVCIFEVCLKWSKHVMLNASDKTWINENDIVKEWPFPDATCRGSGITLLFEHSPSRASEMINLPDNFS